MRAVIKNAPALVLDEATSNMDEHSEHQLIQLIKDHMPTKTVVMIIHNLNFLKDFDKIIFFDENNVVNEGNFEHLIENERFSKFYYSGIEKQASC